MASGAGSESRTVIGMVIFAGVLVSAFLTLYIVPTAYYLLARHTGSPNQRANEIAKLSDEIPYKKGE
jgi:multidrug efflux pump